jgi:hypothetical protein
LSIEIDLAAELDDCLQRGRFPHVGQALGGQGRLGGPILKSGKLLEGAEAEPGVSRLRPTQQDGDGSGGGLQRPVCGYLPDVREGGGANGCKLLLGGLAHGEQVVVKLRDPAGELGRFDGGEGRGRDWRYRLAWRNRLPGRSRGVAEGFLGIGRGSSSRNRHPRGPGDGQD